MTALSLLFVAVFFLVVSLFVVVSVTRLESLELFDTFEQRPYVPPAFLIVGGECVAL